MTYLFFILAIFLITIAVLHLYQGNKKADNKIIQDVKNHPITKRDLINLSKKYGA